MRSSCRIAVRRTLLGRERLGLIPMLDVTKELIDFLSFRQFPTTSQERSDFFSSPNMELMMASLVFMMDSVCPKDLPDYLNLHKTTFDGYDDNPDDDASSGISIGDLNALVSAKPKTCCITPQGCQP